MTVAPGPVFNSSPSWTVCTDGVNGTKVWLVTDFHSTGPYIEDTFTVPCASRAEGNSSSKPKTGKAFLISHPLQARPTRHESWSAEANRCVESRELPGTGQNRCPNPAEDERGGMFVIYRISASSFLFPPVLKGSPTNEPSFRSSFQHSRHSSKSQAEPSAGSFQRSFDRWWLECTRVP